MLNIKKPCICRVLSPSDWPDECLHSKFIVWDDPSYLHEVSNLVGYSMGTWWCEDKSEFCCAGFLLPGLTESMLYACHKDNEYGELVIYFLRCRDGKLVYDPFNGGPETEHMVYEASDFFLILECPTGECLNDDVAVPFQESATDDKCITDFVLTAEEAKQRSKDAAMHTIYESVGQAISEATRRGERIATVTINGDPSLGTRIANELRDIGYVTELTSSDDCCTTVKVEW